MPRLACQPSISDRLPGQLRLIYYSDLGFRRWLLAQAAIRAPIMRNCSDLGSHAGIPRAAAQGLPSASYFINSLPVTSSVRPIPDCMHVLQQRLGDIDAWRQHRFPAVL